MENISRIFLTVYIILLYKCVIWYELTGTTMEQSGLISIVVGVCLWFGLYTGTSKKSK